jgi:hypothetical protein
MERKNKRISDVVLWSAIQAYRGHYGEESKASIAMQYSISEQIFRDRHSNSKTLLLYQMTIS